MSLQYVDDVNSQTVVLFTLLVNGDAVPIVETHQHLDDVVQIAQCVSTRLLEAPRFKCITHYSTCAYFMIIRPQPAPAAHCGLSTPNNALDGSAK